MGEYRRWISYVYSYTDGVKGPNAGYVKIESRNEKCKIYANIKVPHSTIKDFAIYVFYRQEDNIVLVELGKGNMKKGQSEFTYETKDNDIAGSGYRLEQLGGLVGIVDKASFFATVWDDKEINMETAIHYKDEPLSGGEITYEVIKDEADEAEVIKEDAIENEEENSGIDLAAMSNEENERVEYYNSGRDSESILKELEQEKTEQEGQSNLEKSVDRIFARYPGMYPFEDDEVIECVKLDPQDIGVFPMEKWVLANNSFLLHGYYTFRHLIFAKIRGEDAKEKYILGVPGLYRDRERFMAGMFGFDQFKGIRGSERDYGEFGYWYMCMDL